MKLFGGFSHAGLGSLHTTVASNEAEMETSTGEDGLKDTEVYMPDVRGLTEEEAQTKLKASFLTMKVSYTSSDEDMSSVRLRPPTVWFSKVLRSR